MSEKSYEPWPAEQRRPFSQSTAEVRHRIAQMVRSQWKREGPGGTIDPQWIKWILSPNGCALLGDALIDQYWGNCQLAGEDFLTELLTHRGNLPAVLFKLLGVDKQLLEELAQWEKSTDVTSGEIVEALER